MQACDTLWQLVPDETYHVGVGSHVAEHLDQQWTLLGFIMYPIAITRESFNLILHIACYSVYEVARILPHYPHMVLRRLCTSSDHFEKPEHVKGN